MSKKCNALALRRQSIRTLTPAELRVAQGGRGDGTGNGTKTANTGGNGTRTK